MCGIYGHIGESDSVKQCLKGLKFLEYRGYDSAGIVGISEGMFLCFKEKGKLSELEKILENKLLSCQSAIGHTRWATHGKASKQNAHPHLDQKKEIALVHNGIIENYASLRTMLQQKGYVFESETDSEVVAQLISYFYRGDIVEAVQKASALMKGFWGIALIHKDFPHQIIAISRENPIVVGISKNQKDAFVSSDPYAFIGKDLDLYFLKNDEVAVVTTKGVKIFDKASQILTKEPEQIDLPNVEISKGNFEHFMLKEIFEQPQAIRSSLHNRFLMEHGNADFENFTLSDEELRAIKRILIIGCGSSWHAGRIATLQFEALCQIPCQAEIASEYRYKQTSVDPHTLVIVLSQSGETLDTIAATRKVKAEGAKVVALCNVQGSTLMREAHHTILLRAGPEISVCSTKGFVCQLSVLALLVLKFGRLGQMSTTQGKDFLEQLIYLPTIVQQVLEQEKAIQAFAKKYALFPNFFFLGRQYMYPTSLEAALKLKEISYLNASGYAAGELKHGPIALIDSDCVVIGLCGNQLTYEKMLSNLMEVKARDGHILVFAPANSQEVDLITPDVLWLPPVCDELAPIPYSIAAQLLAYFIAKERGTDIDQPRNLAKSVTVE